MTVPTLNKVSGSEFVPAGGQAGRHFPRACGASVLLHGLVFGLLVGLGWMMKDAADPLRNFVVVPDLGTDGAAAGGAAPDADAPTQDEARLGQGSLFAAPPSVRSWTPPAMPAEDRTRPAEREPGRPRTNRTTYGEYVLQNRRAEPRGGPAVAPQPPPGGAGPRITVPGIGPGASADGSSPGRSTAGEEMALYFAELVRQLGERHVKPPGLSDLLNAEVSFTVAADGSIPQLRIVRSSGDAGFDRSVREAFARVKLPKRPDGKTDVRTLIFRIQDA